MRRAELIYLLVDGAHARFVEWSEDKGAFVTFHRLDGEERLEQVRAEQRDEPTGRSFESAGAARHGVGREDAYRRSKEAFAADVARALSKIASGRSVEGVVLAATPRLLAIVRASLPPRANVIAEIGKDLIKTPDHELGRWLGPDALAANR